MKKIAISLIILVCNFASGSEKILTGAFEGDGRDCYGKLLIKTRTIEWITPFNSCKATPYEILSKNLEGINPDIVYKINNKKICPFEIIHLSPDPKNKYYQYAEGYVTTEDYKNKASNFLGCRLEKLGK